MKRTIATCLAITFTIGMLNAQVSEESRVMVNGNQNAIIIHLPQASSSFAEKTWKDFIKKYGRTKNVRKSNELVVEDIQVLNIGGTQLIDIYALTEESGSGSQLVMWVELNGEYVNSDDHSDAFNGCVQLLEDFRHTTQVELISIELDEQSKALDKLENDMKKLRKDNDKYHKIIEDAKERIANAEADIAKNLQDQELAAREIEAQNEIVNEVRKRLDNKRAERGS